MSISSEQITRWRKLRGKGMTSAIGEYTPAEFWELLDAYEAVKRERDDLKRRIDKALQFIEIIERR